MSSDTAISIEGLSKAYRIAHRARATTLVEAVAGAFKKRQAGHQAETFWALRNVGIEVRRGESLGVIGRNGAGKSTLLKILSRITEPTSGEARVWGRVSSLLEVGTGFHPELTGRENVYLNGAILGMRRAEIARRFDEIVAFAEVERFLDTPVKRYSSGMYVRLAFAVAAHLEPDILLVDEVLAVGDIAFQSKCLGRMENATKEGRTILFVSHNLGAVARLCHTAIALHEGQIVAAGDTDSVISRYVADESSPTARAIIDVPSKRDAPVMVSSCRVEGDDAGCRDVFGVSENVTVALRILCKRARRDLEVSIRVHNSLLQPLFTSNLSQSLRRLSDFGVGETSLAVCIPAGFLAPDSYSVTVAVHRPNVEMLDLLEHAVRFRIQETGTDLYGYVGLSGASYGNILTRLRWVHEATRS